MPGIFLGLRQDDGAFHFEQESLPRRILVIAWVVQGDEVKAGLDLAPYHGKAKGTEGKGDACDPGIDAQLPWIVDACHECACKDKDGYNQVEGKIKALGKDGRPTKDRLHEHTTPPGIASKGGTESHQRSHAKEEDGYAKDDTNHHHGTSLIS